VKTHYTCSTNLSFAINQNFLVVMRIIAGSNWILLPYWSCKEHCIYYRISPNSTSKSRDSLCQNLDFSFISWIEWRILAWCLVLFITFMGRDVCGVPIWLIFSLRILVAMV